MKPVSAHPSGAKIRFRSTVPTLSFETRDQEAEQVGRNSVVGNRRRADLSGQRRDRANPLVGRERAVDLRAQ
jgi:hypothetical protein